MNDIFWIFLIISILIPILAFLISGILAPIRQGPEKVEFFNKELKN